jgi:hypothetical protein
MVFAKLEELVATSYAMNTDFKCPKWSGQMLEGFLIEAASPGVHKPSYWVAGVPEPSFWSGTKVDDKEYHPIQSSRCGSCGYLELYARGA